MAITYSNLLIEEMYGDKAVMSYLEICREGFMAGNKTCLFELIELCAQHQAIIPEWAVDEIFKIRNLIESGKISGIDEFLEFKVEHKATRKKRARLKKYTQDVLVLLQKYRLGETNNSLTADDILQTVAEELKISRRDVEDIYKSSGSFIKTLPRGNPDKNVYGIMHGESPPYRRHGRGILKD